MKSWWNPTKVKQALNSYREIKEILYNYGIPSSFNIDYQKLVYNTNDMIEIVLDLEYAISKLDEYDAIIAKDRWYSKNTQFDIATNRNKSQQVISEIIKRAENNIICILCDNNE